MTPQAFRSILRRLSLPLLAASALAVTGTGVQAQSTSQSAAAQVAARVGNRIADGADLSASTRLTGQLPAWVNPARDAGAPSADTVVGLTFVLARSPEQQAGFEQLLADQQNPASPRFHQWLTPAQIGDQYGPTQHDAEAIAAWLRASGLQVSQIAPSRLFIEAHGPSSVVASALKTGFRLFNSLGKTHLSATTEPSLPSAFAAVVASISGLTDFDLLPQSHVTAAPQRAPAGLPAPQYTTTSGNHYTFPKDFATIFDINPLYNAGINGAGQKVAIIGRSQIATTDLTAFESVSALASNVPNIIVATTGVNPGTVSGDEGESDLDLERVIGVAPGVTADFVISGTANGYNGIYVASQYEVQTLMDPVLTLSYGSCEANAGLAGVNLWSTLFSQAAAEGISVFVSSADSGAATCDTQFAAAPATQIRSINYICSNPYTTCVGGTEFVDTTSPTTYWATTNGTGDSSALSYIPEGGWNDPTTTTGFVVEASGGGASTLVTKPSFQTGVGVPADGFRDVPDVSFPASSHDGYFGCEADLIFSATSNGNCATGGGVIFSGTSAAAPGWAGLTALLLQKAGTKQGNLNPLIYTVAATTSNGAFHDVTPATTGIATCDVTVPSLCNNSTPSPTTLTGGLVGYAVTVGYDQVTGWGSADAAKFVAAATLLQPTSVLSITANPTSLTFTAGAASGNTATLTYTASAALSGAVTSTCTVTYNSGTASVLPTCTASGATLVAGGTATGTLTVSSIAPHAGASPFVAGNRSGGSNGAMGGAALAALLLLIVPSSRRRLRKLPLGASLAGMAFALTLLSGCSGGGSAPKVLSGGTTTGAYTITVTGTAGSTSGTVTVPLTIQ